ncbi:hypothetical protein C5167_033790 [Papaver somniferum]|uniref:Uncharacterized protein n=1 Tax=Papaver somniferum TaxID=3469 RepID=A0A4Y7KCS7_PAPSO|nr:hypothetical protein C5167_033790 [Papaver somniferum]
MVRLAWLGPRQGAVGLAWWGQGFGMPLAHGAASMVGMPWRGDVAGMVFHWHNGAADMVGMPWHGDVAGMVCYWHSGVVGMVGMPWRGRRGWHGFPLAQ